MSLENYLRQINNSQVHPVEKGEDFTVEEISEIPSRATAITAISDWLEEMGFSITVYRTVRDPHFDEKRFKKFFDSGSMVSKGYHLIGYNENSKLYAIVSTALVRPGSGQLPALRFGVGPTSEPPTGQVRTSKDLYAALEKKIDNLSKPTKESVMKESIIKLLSEKLEKLTGKKVHLK